MKRNGFTLIEMMIAMFISTLAIFALVSAYTTGIKLMKKSSKHLRAQQEAIIMMNQIGNTIRESSDLDIYNFTPPLTWSTSSSGNFLVAYSPYGGTSAFYCVSNNMYCVPDFSQVSFNSNLTIHLAKEIGNETSFFDDSDSICFKLKIRDDDDTNISLFSSTTYFTPRN